MNQNTLQKFWGLLSNLYFVEDRFTNKNLTIDRIDDPNGYAYRCYCGEVGNFDLKLVDDGDGDYIYVVAPLEDGDEQDFLLFLYTNELEKIKKPFVFYWLYGKAEHLEGCDQADALNKAGYGNGALRALDFWQMGSQEYEWDTEEKKWFKA